MESTQIEDGSPLRAVTREEIILPQDLSYHKDVRRSDDKEQTYRIFRLCSERSITAQVSIGDHNYLCDCHHLTHEPITYRLHLPPSFQFEKLSAQGQSVIIKEWASAVRYFNSRMVDLSEDSDQRQELISLISNGLLPKGQVAYLQESGKLGTVFRELGFHKEPDNDFGFDPSWRELLEALNDSSIQNAWDNSAYVTPPRKTDHLVQVSDISPELLFEAFFNNASSPGAAAMVSMADDSINPGGVVSDVRDLLAQGGYPSIDYFHGRRMKLYVDKDGWLNPGSFDQCAFPGAAAHIVDRIRRSGDVTRCIQYSTDSRGITSGTLIC